MARSSSILDSKFELRSLDILNGEDRFEDCDIDGDDIELADLVSRVQVKTSTDVLPSKNQALCEFCTRVNQLKHC